jgi:hypothetical protein
VISGGSQAVAGRADQFAGAYKALRADSSVQFNLVPPIPRPKPPGWLEALLNWLDHHLFTPIGKALSWIGSFFPDAAYARIILWIVIAAGAAILAWALFNRVRHGEWSLRIPRRADPGRSVEDIASRRPNIVRPALTSRELAASHGIPGRARELFAAIARLVERSLFGGRAVSEGDWLAARAAYSDFALPAAWRA